MLLLMFFGACAGSTSGGAKIDRMVILTKNARNEFNRVLYPNVIRPVLYNGKALSHETVSKILAFTIMYVIVWIMGAVILTLQGANMGEAVYGSLSALSNMGIGIGSDAGGFYSDISLGAKWTLMALMIIGRLEVFTAIIIFMPLFWKKS
jgi:trk system potassium uptake protein TrkH